MKKVLSLVLALVLVLGLSSVAFAADDKFEAKYIALGTSLGKGPQATKDETQNPGFAWEIPITYKDAAMDKAEIRKFKIAVQSRAITGSAVIGKPEIVYVDGAAFVKIALVDDFLSTKDQDFEVELYLTANKSRINTDDAKYIVSGTIENDSQEVNEGQEYVYLYDVPVAKATAYIRSIEVDLGQGVSIFTKMFEGKKYYGKVSQTVKAEDEAVLAKYPDIDTVYYIATIGLNQSGEIVKFDLDANFYAYTQDADGNLVYIGRSNDRLAYYNKYFLSSKELDVDVVIGGEGEPEGETPGEGTPGMGGDDAPANVNDNPSTGR